MKVILDSSIICRDFTLSGSTFRAFFDGLKPTGHSLYIPKVVFDESVNKYFERLKNSKREIEKGIRNLERLTKQEVSRPVGDEDLERLKEEYKQLLQEKFNAIQVRYLNYPQTSHEEITKRALRRRKPFDGDGQKGYRDTLIWESILELASESQTEPIVFVTANVKDFASGNDIQLHQDLLEDLTLRLGDEKGEVVLFKDLEDFVDEHIKPALEFLKNTRSQLNYGKYSDLDLYEFVEGGLASYIGGVELNPLDIDLPREFETPSISSIGEINDISVTDVRQLSTGELLISFLASVEANFDFFVFKPDYYALSDEQQQFIWDRDWNEHYMAGSVSLGVYLNLSLTFDTASKQVTSAQVVEIFSRKRLDSQLDHMTKIFQEFSRQQSERMAKMMESANVTKKTLEPFYQQIAQTNRILEEWSRQQSEQLTQAFASIQTTRISKILEEFNRQQSERMAKIFASFQISDELFKAVNLQIPNNLADDSTDDENSTASPNEEDDDSDESDRLDENNISDETS